MAQDRERRAAVRTNMERHAMFVAIDGSTLLQSGVVTDMSRDGLRLRTRQPAPVGSVIEIEVDPRAGAAINAPVIVRGRVVRVQELHGGECSIGVKLRYRVAKSDAPRAKAATGLPPAKPANKPDSSSPKKPLNIDWRQWAVLGFFVALIGLLLLWPRQNPVQAGNDGVGRGNTLDSPQEAIAESMKRLRTSSNSGVSGREKSNKSDDANAMLPRLPRDSDAKAAQDEVAENKVSTFSDAPRGQTPELIQSVRFADEDAGSPSSVQEDSTEPVGALLAGGIQDRDRRSDSSRRGRINPAVLTHLPNGLALLASARRNEEGNSRASRNEDSPEIVLIVDRGDFTLTVVRNGRFAAQYPISTGANDSTPTGTFTIHNKIRDPDWYNRGETVPHGDPRNPLGGFWMGFAKDGKPLSYGIHATTDTSLIGQPTGRGCIRLKSEHTGELFESCDIGTTVIIR